MLPNGFLELKIIHISLSLPLNGCFGAALRPLLAALGPLLGRSWPLLAALGLLLAAPRPLLGRSWPLLCRSWPLRGHSWAALGRSEDTLGPLLAALGPLLGAQKRIKNNPKSTLEKSIQKIALGDHFCPVLSSQELRARERHTFPIAKMKKTRSGSVALSV